MMKILSLLVAALVLVACGGGDPEPAVAETKVGTDWYPVRCASAPSRETAQCAGGFSDTWGDTDLYFDFGSEFSWNAPDLGYDWNGSMSSDGFFSQTVDAITTVAFPADGNQPAIGVSAYVDNIGVIRTTDTFGNNNSYLPAQIWNSTYGKYMLPVRRFARTPE